MRSERASVYSAIVERLEFIREQPSEEDRRNGWIDFGQFLDWLSSSREKLARVREERESRPAV
jgi:hypothetical protein